MRSYGEMAISQATMARTMEERTATSNDRAKRLEDGLVKLDVEKADAEALRAVVVELRGIKRLLIGLLVSIVIASVTFGLAALQIAGSHT